MFKFDTCWYLELVWDLDCQRWLSGCYRRQAKTNPSIRISADKHKRSLQSGSAAHLKTRLLVSLGQKVLMDLVIYIITAKMGCRLKQGGGAAESLHCIYLGLYWCWTFCISWKVVLRMQELSNWANRNGGGIGLCGCQGCSYQPGPEYLFPWRGFGHASGI